LNAVKWDHILVLKFLLYHEVIIMLHTRLSIYSIVSGYNYENCFFNKWWSTIPPITTKQTITSHLNWTHWTQEKTTTYDVVNPVPGLGQAQKCGGVKPVYWFQSVFIYLYTMYIKFNRWRLIILRLNQVNPLSSVQVCV